MLRRVLLFLLFLFVGFCLAAFPVQTASAADEYFLFSVDKQKVLPGEKIYLSIDAQKQEEIAAGFRLSVEYDDTRLSFVRVETSDQIKSKTLYTDSSGNPVRSTYVCNVETGRPQDLSGEILTYVFEVKEGAAAGESNLQVNMDQICNWDGKQLNRDCGQNVEFTILPAKSGKAYLQSLKPSSGRLEPVFSSDVLEYELNVPSSVSTLEFQAEAGEKGSVRISRKTLQKAGSATIITITVVSENGKERMPYTVTVNRAAVPEEDAYLIKLKPSHGELRPPFSSDVLEYSLDVDADVQYVTFNARAGEDGSVSVSREKLNRAGTSTEITVTAISSDQKNRLKYTVTVNRAETPVDSSITEEPYLTALFSQQGELEPAFSPEQLEYTMQVGAETQTVVFQASASPGATVSINRKMLYKAGSATEIVVTVHSEDKKEKKVYVVTVYRAETESKSQTANAAVVPKNGQTQTRSSSSPKKEQPDGEGQGFTEEETYIPDAIADSQPENLPVQNEVPQATGDLLRESNQLPVFLAGMGGTLLCVMLGAGLVLLLQKYGKKEK